MTAIPGMPRKPNRKRRRLNVTVSPEAYALIEAHLANRSYPWTLSTAAEDLVLRGAAAVDADNRPRPRRK